MSRAIKRRPSRSPLASFFESVKSEPLLTVSEERDLARRIAEGDRAARDRFARANMRLVIDMACRYRGRGLSLEDLLGVGSLGLLHAVDRFQPEREYRFSTYACRCIQGYILHALLDRPRPFRIPRTLANVEYRQQHPELWEVARQALMMTRQPLKVAEDIPDPSVQAIEEEKALAATIERVRRSVSGLPEPYRQTVMYYYGLGCEPISTVEIGRRTGTNREKVSARLKVAKGWLVEMLADQEGVIYRRVD